MDTHDTQGTAEPGSLDPLAGAEADAEREAAQLAAVDPAADAGSDPDGPRVSRPRAKTVKARPTTLSGTTAATADEVIRTDAIHVGQGGLGVVTAGSVDVRQGGIGRLRANDVSVSQGGVGLARADRLSVDRGAVGGAFAGEFHLNQGFVRSVLAGDVHLEQAGSQSIIANQVTMGRGSGAIFVFARRVEGDVRMLFDWRGGLAFGAAFGLVVSLLRLRVRRR